MNIATGQNKLCAKYRVKSSAIRGPTGVKVMMHIAEQKIIGLFWWPLDFPWRHHKAHAIDDIAQVKETRRAKTTYEYYL